MGEILKKIANGKKVYVMNILGDGSCLLRAIAYGMSRAGSGNIEEIETKVKEMRGQIVAAIKNNMSRFQAVLWNYAIEDGYEGSCAEMENYSLKRMEKDGWLGEEALIIISERENLLINVHEEG